MVELKKALCILMVVAGVFVFAGIAGAADCADDPTSQFDKCKQFDCCDQSDFPNVCDIGAQGCETKGKEGCPQQCRKCNVMNIPCQDTLDLGQGKKDSTETCRFDYDDPYGYCGSDSVTDVEFDAEGMPKPILKPEAILHKNVRNCRFFINICECQDACDIDVGEKVGIQMVIKVKEPGGIARYATANDGVYWAEDEDLSGRKLNFRVFTSTQYERNSVDEKGDYPLCYEPFIAANTSDQRYFGNVKYYSSFSFQGAKGTDQGVGRAIYTVTGPVDPYPLGCVKGNIPSGETVNGVKQPDYRATVLQSETVFQWDDGDYTLRGDDAGKCIWMIDVPAMIIDGRARKGTEISVEVRLLWNKELDTKICAGCIVADVCKCERKIALVCCDVSNEGCLFFPYVLQGLKDLPENQSGGWVSGVAISARPLDATTTLALPEGAYCKLTLRDTVGNTATYTNPNPGAGTGGLVWAFVLDSILPQFSKSLKPGACSLMVETNYPIDGYTFMNANMQFGAGTLPRGCYGKIAPGSIY